MTASAKQTDKMALYTVTVQLGQDFTIVIEDSPSRQLHTIHMKCHVMAQVFSLFQALGLRMPHSYCITHFILDVWEADIFALEVGIVSDMEGLAD